MKDISNNLTFYNKLVLGNYQSTNELPDFTSPAFELMAVNHRAELEASIADQIRAWIASDFNKLIEVLYRLDIDEKNLKSLLREHSDEDSGKLIAAMIIDRQLQKLSTRQQNKGLDDIPDDEKW